ncbi:hypothetical protein KGQ55_02445 [Patescibacteria group bacterium]|nr:hypothetical protein [Patescibacteria group bacterium]
MRTGAGQLANEHARELVRAIHMQAPEAVERASDTDIVYKYTLTAR